MPVACAVLALVAAGAFATSTVLQQSRARHHAAERAAGREPEPGRLAWLPVLSVLGAIIRDPVWQVGWLVNAVGFGIHAAALHLGPIAVVQSILVVQLLLAIVIGDIRRHRRPTTRDVLGAVAVCAGVVLLVLQRASAGQRDPDPGHAALYVGIAALAVVALLAVARTGRFGQPWRGAVVGVAAGTCFSCTAVLLTLATDALADDGPAGLLGWPLPALVASTVTGALLVQEGFSSAPLPAPLTAMTVTDPTLSALAGALLFDAAPPSLLQVTVGLPAAGVLIAVGVAMLAGSPTLRDELGSFQAAAADPASDACRSRNLRTVSDQG